jgi:hypothetical protein
MAPYWEGEMGLIKLIESKSRYRITFHFQDIEVGPIWKSLLYLLVKT